MLVSRAEKPRLLESRNAILGLLEDAVDAEATLLVPVRPGDRLIIYTDGLTESFNSQHEMLGGRRIEENRVRYGGSAVADDEATNHRSRSGVA